MLFSKLNQAAALGSMMAMSLLFSSACNAPSGTDDSAEEVTESSESAVSALSMTFSGYTSFVANNPPRPFIVQWQAPAATSCVASGAWTGSKPSGGTHSISSPGTYRLTCTNGSVSAFKDLTISCATLQSGLNFGGQVCALCSSASTAAVVTGSNGQQAMCIYQSWNNRFHICASPTGTGVGSPLCGDGPVPAPLAVPTCTYTYGAWSACVNGKQTRIASASPDGCAGTPVTTQACASSPPPAPPPPPPPPVSVVLKANQQDATRCARNRTFQLSWTVSPNDPSATCVATTGNWSPSNGNPQSVTFTGTGATTYGIRCSANGQVATDTVTVSPL